MTHKAKRRDNGEWVEGDCISSYCIGVDFHGLTDEDVCFKAVHEIKPSTLCEKARGTDFFEADEVADGNITGFIKWDKGTFRWIVALTNKIGMELYHTKWKPTGRNYYDDK